MKLIKILLIFAILGLNTLQLRVLASGYLAPPSDITIDMLSAEFEENTPARKPLINSGKVRGWVLVLLASIVMMAPGSRLDNTNVYPVKPTAPLIIAKNESVKHKYKVTRNEGIEGKTVQVFVDKAGLNYEDFIKAIAHGIEKLTPGEVAELMALGEEEHPGISLFKSGNYYTITSVANRIEAMSIMRDSEEIETSYINLGETNIEIHYISGGNELTPIGGVFKIRSKKVVIIDLNKVIEKAKNIGVPVSTLLKIVVAHETAQAWKGDWVHGDSAEKLLEGAGKIKYLVKGELAGILGSFAGVNYSKENIGIFRNYLAYVQQIYKEKDAEKRLKPQYQLASEIICEYLSFENKNISNLSDDEVLEIMNKPKPLFKMFFGEMPPEIEPPTSVFEYLNKDKRQTQPTPRALSGSL